MLVRIGLILITSVAAGHCSDVLKHMYVDHIICNTSADVCPGSICKLTFLTRKVKALTWTCDVAKPIDLLHFQVTLFYRFRNGYQKFLIDLNIDSCLYFNNTLGSAVLDLIRDEMEKYSTNMLRPCPYTRKLSLNKMPLDGTLLKYIFVPSGEYKLVIEGKYDEKKLFAISLAIFFSIPAGLTLEDDRMG